MTDNPLREAQRLGIRAVNDLGVLFGRLGTTAHPNSQPLIAYRAANRALREIMKSGGSVSDARDITRQLAQGVRAGIEPVFQAAATAGYNDASRQLRVYKTPPPPQPDLSISVRAAYDVIQTSLDRQAAAITALMLSGSDEALIVGDEIRQGVLKPAEIISQSAFWVANLWWGSFSQTADLAGGGFQKQAVAALDERTTDCCLRVHGQIAPLNGDFHLTGTPRYADWLPWPPFHFWCRTSGVLYLGSYDDGLTDRMTDSAAQVLAEREAGVFKPRHPADAFI